MKQDLETLKTEILEYLESKNFVVFRGCTRMADSLPAVYWDTERYPDYRQFLKVARQAEVNIIVFHHRELSSSFIDETLDRLENSEMPPEEYQGLERRLRDLRAYEGFTCALEMSFDYQGRLYLFAVRTSWFEELLDIADEIDETVVEEESDDEAPMGGGYFSRN